MEYKPFLIRNKTKLLEITDCNVTVIAQCIKKRILSQSDRSKLKAETDQIIRNDKFWEIIETRKNCWDDLIDIFREDVQTSVSDLLEQAKVNSSGNPVKLKEQPVGMSRCSDDQTWKLTFPVGVKSVLPKVQADLVQRMAASETGSTEILLQLNGLGIFDQEDIGPLLYNKWFTQKERMNQLFAQLYNLDPDEILNCLELLCNLKVQPNTSKRIRNVFSTHFQDSVYFA